MDEFRNHKRLAISLAAGMLVMLVVTGVSIAGEQPKAAPAPAVDSKYVGSDTCATCHEDLAKGLERTPHYKMKFQSHAKDAATGCESCHGPGAAHVDGGGDVTKIVSFKKLTTKQASDRCLSCHASNEHANFARSVHQGNDVGCTSCHSPHHAQDRKGMLLVKDQPELCFSCHTEQRAEFSKPYRHRVAQGLVECIDCHNEHGGNVSKQLRSTANNDQVCFKCHTEKQGPFVYEHFPVKADGCSACHTPHGSTNPRLLKTSKVDILCLQCHTATHNVASSLPPVGPSKDLNARYQACILCHTYIHGSNSGNYLNKP